MRRQARNYAKPSFKLLHSMVEGGDYCAFAQSSPNERHNRLAIEQELCNYPNLDIFRLHCEEGGQRGWHERVRVKQRVKVDA